MSYEYRYTLGGWGGEFKEFIVRKAQSNIWRASVEKQAGRQKKERDQKDGEDGDHS